jgi:DNA-binding protein Fis
MDAAEQKNLFVEKRGEIYHYVIKDVEKTLIEQALAHSSGNQILAAKILGINRNTIRSKIRKLGIKPSQFKL